MLHHPTKYHPNAITHFLNLHTSTMQTSQSNIIGTNSSNLYSNSNNVPLGGQNQLCNQQHHNDSNTSIIELNHRSSPNSTQIDGKSFTIAAILGLNNNNASNRNFNEVVNLSLNQAHTKLLGGCFDRLPHIYDGTLPSNNTLQNGHTFNTNNNHHHPASGHALKNLQQFNQHVNTAFVNREKYKSVLDQAAGKKSSIKSKRVRTIFTPEQLERLEAEFERQQYMVGPERLYLAHTLQLSESQVKVWFQNRRIKWRKHHLEVTQQRLAIIRQRQISNGQNIPDENPSQNSMRLSSTSPELTVCSESLESESDAE